VADVLVAGLPDGASALLRARLPGVRVHPVGSGEALLDALGERAWSLAVLDSALPGLPAPDLLRDALRPAGAPPVPLIFCARGRPDADTVRALGVRQLLFHPLDGSELLRHAAAILGVAPAPPAEAERRAEVSAVVASMWERFRDAIFARVATLESAAAALREGRLDDAARRDAEREAHKLAGAAGTFGFHGASHAAAEAEALLAGSVPPGVEEGHRLRELVASIRAGLERSPGAASPEPRVVDEPLPFVLIVDDDRELAERLAEEARGRRLRAEVAAGLATARGVLTRERPDVVLLDLTLRDPADDALGFLQELSREVPPVPVVVLTARGGFGDRLEVARRGGIGYLQKPVAPAKVVEVLRDALQRQQAAEQTVLAVDDDPQVLAAVRGFLEQSGLRVVTLNDPLRFWEVLEQTAPHLLVLDVDMPHVSGIEICRVVRNDPRCNALPVLFLTARKDPETIRRIFDAGADDYVGKPFVGPELMARIRNRLERIHLHRALAETDPLTGVANRRKSEEVMTHFLHLAARQQRPFSLAVLDMDRFKDVNDRYGHAAGDDVLQRMAAILQRTFRAEDVVARWGGEEFVVGMFGMGAEDGVRRLDQLRGRVAEEEFSATGGTGFSVSFSAGIAEFPRDGRELAELYRAADEALYRSKEAGRDRVTAAGTPHPA